MHSFLGYALVALLVAVTLTLFAGIYALFKGGTFGRSWSNRLMRLRVALQFAAVLVICAAAFLAGKLH
jgi:hypothetical protein